MSQYETSKEERAAVAKLGELADRNLIQSYTITELDAEVTALRAQLAEARKQSATAKAGWDHWFDAAHTYMNERDQLKCDLAAEKAYVDGLVVQRDQVILERDHARGERAEARERIAALEANEQRGRNAAALFIEENGATCDCCQHVLIDVTACSSLTERQHVIAGDCEGEGSACAFTWHEACGKAEAERDECKRRTEAVEQQRDTLRQALEQIVRPSHLSNRDWILSEVRDIARLALEATDRK